MSRSILRATWAPAALACAAVSSTGPLRAQNAPDTATDSATPAITEIIVTAQKREQRAQDVPIPVQVLSGDTLQAQGVREFTDLTKVAPSLVIKPAENPVNASVSIRGIGTFAFSPGVEPSVAVQLDDVPVTFLARAFADLADIERIEVLRGPQSTLYGRSASAGLINIVTAAPTRSLAGRLGAIYSTDDEYGASGSVSGPLGNTFGFRLSANWNKFEGNVRNLVSDSKVSGHDTFSTRGKLVWDPADALDITLQGSYVDGSTTIGRPYIALGPNARLRGVPAFDASVFAPGVSATSDNRDVVNNVTSGTDYRDLAQSLRISLDLGKATFMSITAHDTYDEFDLLDQDESAVAALDNRQFGNFDSSQFSQEFRLISPETQRLRYTVGLFYSDFDYTRDFTRGPFFALARWFATNGSKQYAGFSQLEFDLRPGTTLIGGARAGHERIEVTFNDIQNANAYFSGHSADSYSTWKAGIQQHLAEDVMGFLTFATGHKGQAYDISTGFNANRLDPVDPETSRDWQLGLKSQWLAHRVTLNATLFDTRFKGFQAQGIETLPDGTTNFRLANVGKLRTRGVELEGSVLAADALSFSGGVTYLDAKITEFPFAQCYPGQTAAQGCVGSPARQNLAGFRPAQAPQWKLTVAADFSPHLTSSLDGLVQASVAYQSEINYSLSQDPQTVQPAYTLVNLSAGVREAGRKWEVVAFVDNLLDKQYFSNLADSFGNFGNNLATQSYLPRDFRRYGGVRASFNF